MDQVLCTGNELKLVDCCYDRNTTNCDLCQDAGGVICSYDIISEWPAQCMQYYPSVFIIMLFFFGNVVMPQTLNVSVDNSNRATLRWQSPVVNTRHGTISNFFINCSAQRESDEQTAVSFDSFPNQVYIVFNLIHSNTLYQCCVSAVDGYSIMQTSHHTRSR